MDLYQHAYVAPGILHVKIHRVKLDNPVKRGFVTLKDSTDKEYKTSVSDDEEGCWSEGFEIPISFHSALFDTLRIDLFESGVLFNSHVGRTTLRIFDVLASSLEFSSWYELTSKQSALVAVNGSYSRHSASSLNNGIGAIHIGFHFKPEPKDDVDAEAKEPDINAAPTSVVEEEEALFLNDTKYDVAQGFDVVDKLFFLSGETRTVLKAVRRLLTAYKQGFTYSNLSIFSGLAALESFYQTQTPVRTGQFVTNLQFIQTSTHFHRFAMAAYGWRGLNFFGKRNTLVSDAVSSQADLKAVTQFLGLEEGAMLLSAFGNVQISQRTFFVVVDKLSNSLVLAIRGTMSHSDTLVDLACEYQKWRGGYVHSGIKASANWFFKNVVPKCITFAKERGVSNFVITGHSLGSGVAAFLAIMIESSREALELPDTLNVEAFCYCPPCIISANLINSVKARIHSFVYDTDLVPRLSYGSMMDLKSVIVGVMDRADATLLANLKDVVSGIEPEKQQQVFATLERIRANVLDTERYAKLYVPGTVYQLYTVAQPPQETWTTSTSIPSSPVVGTGVAPQRTSSLGSSRPSSPVSCVSDDSQVCNSSIKLAGPVSPRLAQDDPAATGAPETRPYKLVQGRQVVMEVVDSTQLGELWISTSSLYNHLPSTIDIALETLYNQTMYHNQMYHKRLDLHRQEQSFFRMNFVRGSFLTE